MAVKNPLVLLPGLLCDAALWQPQMTALADIAKSNQHLTVSGEGRPVPFDAAGNLEQEKLFPHSVRGRRKH